MQISSAGNVKVFVYADLGKSNPNNVFENQLLLWFFLNLMEEGI
jgi:hypothetical protein